MALIVYSSHLPPLRIEYLVDHKLLARVTITDARDTYDRVFAQRNDGEPSSFTQSALTTFSSCLFLTADLFDIPLRSVYCFNGVDISFPLGVWTRRNQSTAWAVGSRHCIKDGKDT